MANYMTDSGRSGRLPRSMDYARRRCSPVGMMGADEFSWSSTPKQLTGPPRVGETDPILSCGHPFPASAYRENGIDQRTSSTVNMRKEMKESTHGVGKVDDDKYDAGGRLEKMTGPAGEVTEYKYDELGNKISVSDPDRGIWKYRYELIRPGGGTDRCGGTILDDGV